MRSIVEVVRVEDGQLVGGLGISDVESDIGQAVEGRRQYGVDHGDVEKVQSARIEEKVDGLSRISN